MTIADYKATLDTLDDAGFATFRRDFGGDFETRQQYVDDFVHHPEHERRLCQVLRLTTEEDKRTLAGQDALGIAKEANRIAQEANAYSAVGELGREASKCHRQEVDQDFCARLGSFGNGAGHSRVLRCSARRLTNNLQPTSARRENDPPAAER